MLRHLTLTIWHTPVRLLHPVRRRVSMARLRHRSPPASVWFICHGNICRSPFAAEVLRLALPPPMRDAIRIDSAGFAGSGRPPPPEAVRVAATHGVALSTHRSKSLTCEVVAGADLLVVMDPVQRRLIRERFTAPNREVVILGDLDPFRIDGRVIADPVDQSDEVFEQTYARIARCVRELARAIGGRLPPMGTATGRSGA